MRRLLRRLIVFASVLGLVMALNVGTAFAVHEGPSPAFGATVDDAPSPRPVGSHISDSGRANGLENQNSNFFVAVANNPNCPFHY